MLQMGHKLISFTAYFLQLEKGVDGLFDSFARLDSRISSVGQTAAKIGDHLQVRLSIVLAPLTSFSASSWLSSCC